MAYKHGISGEQVATQELLSPSGVGIVPIYVGTAPVGSLTDSSGAINVPLLLTSYEDAKAKIGYSDDWAVNTLCEAVYAHFKNGIKNIGPIIVINVFDPEVHTAQNPVDETDIIGAVSAAGVRSGLECIDLVYQKLGIIPSIIAAPGWSHKPTVEAAMIEKCQKINGHWDAICVVDIDSSSAKTVAAAETWKTTNAYTSKLEKLCWPKAKKGSLYFWLSTLAVVRMQQTDYSNDNIPYESPSNKQLDITGTVLGDHTAIDFDEVQANDLNSKGISTINYRGGMWVLWGPHNANYSDGTTIDPKEKFDAGIRMMMYLTNMFQLRYMSSVDAPLSRAKVDTILNDANLWLSGLVSDGKLLYGQIAFNESSNPVSSILEGDFVFDVRTTTTPPGKSLTFKVQYTTEGLDALFGGES